jgi:hypothetical protein
MTARKPRKRAYIPPPTEVDNRKERASGAGSRRVGAVKGAGRTSTGAGGRAMYTLPNGRKIPVPPEPSVMRTLKQLPIYFALVVAFYYFMGPKGTTSDARLIGGVSQGAILIVVITPMMLWLDKRRYRQYLRAIGRGEMAKDKAAAKQKTDGDEGVPT